MGLESISAPLVTRLRETGDSTALAAVAKFESGQLTLPQLREFVNDFFGLVRADLGGALARSARLHGPSGVSYDPRAIALLGDIGRTSDLSLRNRGADVGRMEEVV